MATYSVINYKDLERSKRIDAKYYQPKYLILDELYSRGKWSPIRNHLRLCEYGLSIKMNTSKDGYKIFRMNDLMNGFPFDNEMKYAPIDFPTFKKFKMNTDDILFNRVNSEEYVGRTGIFKLAGDFVFASYLVRARTKSNLSPDVLNLFLNSKYGILTIQRLSRRAVNQANVNAQEMQSILIPQFSNSFQERLANLSNESWELHDLSKQKFMEAEKMLHSIVGINNWEPNQILTFQGMISESITANRLDAEHFQPKYLALRERIKSYPHGYSNITNLAIVSQEMIKPQSHPEKEYKYIELANINKSIGVIKNRSIIKGKDAPSRARMVLEKGDVIASSVEGSLDKVALVTDEDENAIASTGFFVLRPKTIESPYLLALCKSVIFCEQMHCEATGTILTAVPARYMQNVIVPNIPQERRIQIADMIKISHNANHHAKKKFIKAIQAIDIFIEKGEEAAINLLV